MPSPAKLAPAPKPAAPAPRPALVPKPAVPKAATAATPAAAAPATAAFVRAALEAPSPHAAAAQPTPAVPATPTATPRPAVLAAVGPMGAGPHGIEEPAAPFRSGIPASGAALGPGVPRAAAASRPTTTVALPKAATPSDSTFPKAARKPAPAKAPLAPLAPAKAPRPGAGQPMPPHIQEAIQNSLMVDLSAVRLHASTAAQRKAQSFSARAFTFGSDVYLGDGEHPTDLTLISHEAAHVIQQQGVAAVHTWSQDRGDRFEREADQAAQAVSRGERFTVRERVDSPRVQRLGISDALNYVAKAAYNIPGFRMFTLVLGVNPVTMEPVERSAANVLRAVVEFIPGGAQITEALDKHGIFDKVGNWMQRKLGELALVGGSIKKALMDFLDTLSWRDIFALDDVWARAKRIFTDPIDRIKKFVAGTLEDIWKFVRDAILAPLAKLAEGTSGWPLLTAVLGKNPITGEEVPRTPENLIGGFMKLIHEDELWANIHKANAIARCWAWFQGAMSALKGFVNQLPDLFKQTLKSLDWTDVINLPQGFRKVAGIFGGFLGNFISWAGNAVWNLLEIVFDAVAPAVMPYLRKVGAAFRKILKAPLDFVRHLVDAAKLGLENFAGNFVEHLKKALLDWLTGSLPGVYIPKALSLVEFGKFALSVLGISWGQIRAKIVKALGPNGEAIMKGLETAFDVIVALVTGGPAAAWEVIKDKLTNLKDMVVDGIVGFVTDTIIKKAIPKLVSMFIPGAGFISAIVSIYDTIMVFVNKLAKIAAVVKSFVDSIVNVANGQIEGAAKRVEGALESVLSLVISFLAGFLGLGDIASKVLAVIEKVRATVDKALDTAITWIITKAKQLFARLFGKGDKASEGKDQHFVTKGGESHDISYAGEDKDAVPMIASSQKKSVPAKLAEWAQQASAAQASALEQSGKALIDSTKAMVAKDPNDPNLVINMKQLFETYDEGAGKKTIVSRRTGSLAGDTVGLEMTVDWLGPDHKTGTPPKSGVQAKLMSLLVTDPGERSPDKYVRGHLLNEHLGGEGDADNLFPITGNANSQHLHSTESTVKNWVKEKARWVLYQVRVDSVSSKLDESKKKNFVNCEFVCKAVQKDAAGEIKNQLATKITSQYESREHYEVEVAPSK